jgi:hypothetical protein
LIIASSPKRNTKVGEFQWTQQFPHQTRIGTSLGLIQN